MNPALRAGFWWSGTASIRRPLVFQTAHGTLGGLPVSSCVSPNQSGFIEDSYPSTSFIILRQIALFFDRSRPQRALDVPLAGPRGSISRLSASVNCPIRAEARYMWTRRPGCFVAAGQCWRRGYSGWDAGKCLVSLCWFFLTISQNSPM